MIVTDDWEDIEGPSLSPPMSPQSIHDDGTQADIEATQESRVPVPGQEVQGSVTDQHSATPVSSSHTDSSPSEATTVKPIAEQAIPSHSELYIDTSGTPSQPETQPAGITGGQEASETNINIVQQVMVHADSGAEQCQKEHETQKTNTAELKADMAEAGVDDASLDNQIGQLKVKDKGEMVVVGSGSSSNSTSPSAVSSGQEKGESRYIG